MRDLHDATPTALDDTVRPVGAARYRGPDRRRSSEPSGHWLGAILDELDYGVVLLAPDGDILHINQAATLELDAGYALQRVGHRLQARRAADAVLLRTALCNASQRGLRKLVTLGEGRDHSSVSVMPLAVASGASTGTTGVPTLLVFGKRHVCESLSVQGFAKSHQLTTAETRVLAALCDGLPPSRIADEIGVAISTIRTHIGTIRVKTGSESIRALVGRVAQLPPLRGALRQASACGAAAG